MAIWLVACGAALAVAIWLVRRRTHASEVRRREAQATAEWIAEPSHPPAFHPRPSAPRPRPVTVDLARAREKETTQHMLS